MYTRFATWLHQASLACHWKGKCLTRASKVLCLQYFSLSKLLQSILHCLSLLASYPTSHENLSLSLRNQKQRNREWEERSRLFSHPNGWTSREDNKKENEGERKIGQRETSSEEPGARKECKGKTGTGTKKKMRNPLRNKSRKTWREENCCQMKMKLNEIHYNNWREASEQNEKKESKKRLQGQEQQAVNQKEEEKEDNFLLRKKERKKHKLWSVITTHMNETKMKDGQRQTVMRPEQETRWWWRGRMKCKDFKTVSTIDEREREKESISFSLISYFILYLFSVTISTLSLMPILATETSHREVLLAMCLLLWKRFLGFSSSSSCKRYLFILDWCEWSSSSSFPYFCSHHQGIIFRSQRECILDISSRRHPWSTRRRTEKILWLKWHSLQQKKDREFERNEEKES